MAPQRKPSLRSDEERNALVESNLGLIGYTIRRWFPRLLSDHERYADAFQAGVMGLMKAAERYDDTRGIKFSTYAVWWARQAVGRWVDAEGSPGIIRVPPNRDDPSGRRKLRRKLQPLALAVQNRAGEWGHRAIIDPRAAEPGEEAASREELQRIERKLERAVTPRERQAILGRMEGLTLAEIGEAMGIGRERARQLIAKGKERLELHLAN